MSLTQNDGLRNALVRAHMSSWPTTCFASGRYFLCMKMAFQDRSPTADDEPTIGVVDIEIVLARLYSQPHLKGEYRCDFHPCWSRDYTKVAIDSNHEGDRQVYVVDVGDLDNLKVG